MMNVILFTLCICLYTNGYPTDKEKSEEIQTTEEQLKVTETSLNKESTVINPTETITSKKDEIIFVTNPTPTLGTTTVYLNSTKSPVLDGEGDKKIENNSDNKTNQEKIVSSPLPTITTVKTEDSSLPDKNKDEEKVIAEDSTSKNETQSTLPDECKEEKEKIKRHADPEPGRNKFREACAFAVVG
ncbi:uncharacterized protein [Onthophagus taurus]|uniref:uncharacterized protein n=1 Tax=Onthophagus taurus TaxID=166361 RepID=UPI000C20B8FE|nr:uncharacterized protein LOC111425897 [Onthophagus taurus]